MVSRFVAAVIDLWLPSGDCKCEGDANNDDLVHRNDGDSSSYTNIDEPDDHEHDGDSSSDSNDVSNGDEPDLQTFAVMFHVLKKGRQYRGGIQYERNKMVMLVVYFWRWRAAVVFRGSVAFSPYARAVQLYV